MDKTSLLSRLAGWATCFALGVIALGAFTRLLDAGLGCPDWPGCYGHWLAPTTSSHVEGVVAYKAWAEMIHRYVVGALSLFILFIIGLIATQKKYRHPVNSLCAVLLVALLTYQILLGQWTVTLKLLPIIVTQHLLGGFLILSVLWCLYLHNQTSLTLRIRASTRFSLDMSVLATLGLVFVFIQVLLGAWTSTNYASLSCADFPLCMNHQAMTWDFRAAFSPFSPVGLNYEGGVLPQALRQTIQMTHRMGALIVTVYWLFFSAMALPRWRNALELVKSLYVVLGLLCIQLCLGMANVILKLPLWVAECHTIVAALLLLAALTLVYKLLLLQRKA